MNCCCLLPLCEYVIYIYHVCVVKISLLSFLYCYIVVHFEFRGINWVSGIHRVWFQVWIMNRNDVQGGFKFRVGFLGSSLLRVYLT
jgi:hypothetical protein